MGGVGGGWGYRCVMLLYAPNPYYESMTLVMNIAHLKIITSRQKNNRYINSYNMQEYLYQLASTMRQFASHVDDDHPVSATLPFSDMYCG